MTAESPGQNPWGITLVSIMTKHLVDKVKQGLRRFSADAISIHGDGSVLPSNGAHLTLRMSGARRQLLKQECAEPFIGV